MNNIITVRVSGTLDADINTNVWHTQGSIHTVVLDDLVSIGPVCEDPSSAMDAGNLPFLYLEYNRQYNRTITLQFESAPHGFRARKQIHEAMLAIARSRLNQLLGKPLLRVYLDFDDTVFDTFPVLHRKCFELTGFKPNPNDYLTPENTEGHLLRVLSDGTFMSDTPLRKGFEYIGEWMQRMLDRYSNLSFGAITHRGYHADAEALSQPLLDKHNLPFSDVIYLNPDNHADKILYLESLPPHKFLIVDDRPRFDGSAPLPETVLLMDQPWNQHITPFSHTHRVTSLQDIEAYIESVMSGL